jgi:hypothetical protein
MRAALIALLVLGAAAAAVTTAAHADPASSPSPPKASSLAPHAHGGVRSYGAPIQPRILNHVYHRPRKTGTSPRR